MQNSLTVFEKWYKQLYTYLASSLLTLSIIEKNLVFKDNIDKTKGFYLINNKLQTKAFPLITELPFKYIITLINYSY